MQKIYTLELLGDATIVTVRAGGTLVTVKADKEYQGEVGAKISISLSSAQCHLFDKETGKRVI